MDEDITSPSKNGTTFYKLMLTLEAEFSKPSVPTRRNLQDNVLTDRNYSTPIFETRKHLALQ